MEEHDDAPELEISDEEGVAAGVLNCYLNLLLGYVQRLTAQSRSYLVSLRDYNPNRIPEPDLHIANLDLSIARNEYEEANVTYSFHKLNNDLGLYVNFNAVHLSAADLEAIRIRYLERGEFLHTAYITGLRAVVNDMGLPELLIPDEAPNPYPECIWPTDWRNESLVLSIRLVNTVNELVQDRIVEMDINCSVFWLRKLIQAYTGFAFENIQLDSSFGRTMEDYHKISFYIPEARVDDFFIKFSVDTPDPVAYLLYHLKERGLIHVPVPISFMRGLACVGYTVIVGLYALQRAE